MSKRGIYTSTLLAVLITIGCSDSQVSSEGTAATPAPAPDSDEVVAAVDETAALAEPLFWVQSDIHEGDFVLSLGHRRQTLRGGEELKPVVRVVKDANDVAEAVVHNSLVAEDRETVLVEERPTVFKPQTGDEPGHYAEGNLQIPTDAEKFLIRFRIQLPDSDFESQYDMECAVTP